MYFDHVLQLTRAWSLIFLIYALNSLIMQLCLTSGTSSHNIRLSLHGLYPKEKSEKGEQVKKETRPIPLPRPSYPKATHDSLAIRTIVVSGISAEIDTKSSLIQSCSTRNIPFNTSQQDLRALFLPYGPIYSIHINPLETNTDDTNVTNDGEEPSPTIEFSTKITIPNPRIRVRLDPITAEHPCADALRVLLWANNNPSVAELWEEWWKEELVALLQAEKIRPENEKEESRIKRVEGEIEKLESGGGGGTVPKKSRGTLIVDFSIENVQVVRRRRVMQDEQRNADGTQKRDPKNATAVPSQT
ncbi:uncharacterized protein C8R40DRAFT_1073319 [Lentinula edodes]|uniref:uncharacterized protein n=1 Tax=Lentinula edodes TaxID=5353 RepID=UPI001E8D9EC0|nr:uncharacterized protein C8R40DRAFT_1073319 [Lentinula edodes]KAH7870441.1 hypothetical protein C8R40DRAFT_1073319 [Lentinula edodes]